ncbi:hypothetical protein M1373_03600 [Candidatus Marsarchaeota archaeon]|nr:hypothetical protein [Candidatus Marsarchaeota archaeon]MCL5405004.1 hypothetical protein [Candidatus Marsarchaeota archaeon]
MEHVYYSLAFMFLIFTAGYAGAQIVGTASIHAPAVILENNSGVITVINLTVTKGIGYVSISGPAVVGNSTLNSSVAAAHVASALLHKNFNDYNFSYDIYDAGANVSGPSAGTAMTLLALSALSGRPLMSNFTVTGVINYNGSIGLIGGAYDKIGAAKSGGMGFIMVPFAGNDSLESEIYYIAEKYFGIEVVPISNVSQAFAYASGAGSIAGKGIRFDNYVNYSVSKIPQATISCSNFCNQSTIMSLADYTFNFTNSSLLNASRYSGFKAITSNMSALLGEAQALSDKGYYYAGADIAFIDYLNSFMFQNPHLTKQQGFDLLGSIEDYCSSLTPPNLTAVNYNYIANGELRQLWGNVTITSLLDQYNATAIDSDGILRNVYSGAEAYAWCNAASHIYSSGYGAGAAKVAPNSELGAIASSEISKALSGGDANVPGVYLISGEQALKSGNYPVALLDAAYIRTDEVTNQSLLSNAQLEAGIESMVNGTRYGSWATQFDAEALFYLNESMLARNSSNATNYLLNGYNAAMLAGFISNATSQIKSNLVPVSTTPESTNQTAASLQAQFVEEQLAIDIIIVLLIIIIALLIAILVVLLKLLGSAKTSGQRRSKTAAQAKRANNR